MSGPGMYSSGAWQDAVASSSEYDTKILVPEQAGSFGHFLQTLLVAV
jgi:hypothetical protein